MYPQQEERFEKNPYQIEIHTHSVCCSAEDGTILAEVTFPDAAPGVVDINHTFVDERLRGQGIASRMLKQVAQELKETGRRAKLSCSYAVTWFAKHPEWREVLA